MCDPAVANSGPSRMNRLSPFRKEAGTKRSAFRFGLGVLGLVRAGLIF